MSEKFTFFWKETEENGIFSNWYRLSFTIDGVEYNCTEQHMMAGKAKLFGDTKTLAKIMKETSPRALKKLGKEVKPYDDGKWKAVSRNVVYEGNYGKFSQNAEAKELLIATVGTTLVEASPYDQLWGIGLKGDHKLAQDRATWQGTNWLGQVLTKLRDDLIAGTKTVEFNW